MGSSCFSTIVYSGTAKTPRSGGRAAELSIELVVDPSAGRIVAVTTDAGLPSLDQLLWEVLVGAQVARSSETALLEVEVRYCSPITDAVCNALSSALRRAQQDVSRPVGPTFRADAPQPVGVLAG
jgi:hypothetical protein